MAYSIAQLREMTDDQLISEHDEQAQRTVVGTDYYVAELDRRALERSSHAAQELAIASTELASRTYWLTFASFVLSGVATVVALMALFLR